MIKYAICLDNIDLYALRYLLCECEFTHYEKRVWSVTGSVYDTIKCVLCCMDCGRFNAKIIRIFQVLD